MRRESWLLANWELAKHKSIYGSVLVKCKDESIYYLYHTSINQLECFIFNNSEYSRVESHITPGGALEPGDYIEYHSFENIC